MAEQENIIVRPRGGRPPVGGATKTPISFRIHPDLLEGLQQLAKERGVPYQTLMHEILAEEMANIRNYERGDERQKVASMLYQLDRIATRLSNDCPSFTLWAQDLEELADGLGEEARSQICNQKPSKQQAS